MAPLKFWEGDRFVWKNGEKLAEIAEVVRKPTEEPRPLGKHKRGVRGRSAGASRTRSLGPDVDDGTGCDNNTNVKGIVAVFDHDAQIGPNGQVEDQEEIDLSELELVTVLCLFTLTREQRSWCLITSSRGS